MKNISINLFANILDVSDIRILKIVNLYADNIVRSLVKKNINHNKLMINLIQND